MITKTSWITPLAAVVLALLCNPGKAASTDHPDSPEIIVPACPAPPFLDGVLTDACWQAAAEIAGLAILKMPGATAPHKARLCRDGQWLYVAVEVAHPEPAHVKKSVLEHDGSVQTDDALELFIDPGSSGAFYLHYCLNAANIKSDQLILRSGSRDRQARMPWRSAVLLTDSGWNAEMAFPWHVLVRETQYHRQAHLKNCDWANARFNLCVNVVKPVFDAYGARMADERQFAAWAPLEAGYHEPERFGRLKGIVPDQSTNPENNTTAPLFWPWLANVRVGNYELRTGQPVYTLVADIKNTAYSTGVVEITAADQPVAGEAGEVRGRAALGISRQIDLTLEIPLKISGRRTALVRMNDAVRGGTFETRRLSEQEMEATEPFAAWLDRSYYTDENHARVVCRLRLPAAALAGQSMAVRDQSGQTLAQSAGLAADNLIDVPLAGFRPGEHKLGIAWHDAGGQALSVQTLMLRKLAPNPGCEIKVDRVNGAALKDGRPIFPFGLLQPGLTGSDGEYFKHMAEAGFNTVVWWGRDWQTGPAEYGAFLETARRHGLMVVDACTGIKPLPPALSSLRHSRGLKVFDRQKTFSGEEEVEIALQDFDRILPALKATWAVAAKAPNLIGYYNVDEPNLGNQPANAAILERFYREFKLADPYRPSVNLFACHIPAGGQWTRWGDIFAYDPYIYPGWGRFDYGQPNFVAREVLELKRRIDSVHKGIWIVPIAFQMDPGRTPRGLTAAEQHCQTYLALIHGAKGLLYFSGESCYAQAGWNALSRLAQQMKILGPAVTAPSVSQQVEYKPTVLDADKSVFPEVQAALFRHPDGRHVLLAANGRNYPVTAAFTINGLQTPGFPRNLLGKRAVENLFDGRPLSVTGAAFTDEFEGYGVRAYALEISASHISNHQFQINVLSEGHPDAVPAEQTYPVAEIRKRKNVMPNPSLEIQTIPDVPDYIRPNMYLDWPLVGAPGAGWGLDADHPFHGAQCLRLVHRVRGGEPPDANHRITIGVFYPPVMKEPATYTFSLYARAARDGDELSVYIGSLTPNSPGARWKLTREWQRYTFTGELSSQSVPGAIGGCRSFFLYTWSKDAVVWVDALQMEAGAAPSEFTAE